MKPTKIRSLVSLLCGAATFVLVAYSIISFLTVGGEANMQVTGVRCFRYFTNDSNILAAFACLALIPAQIRALRSESGELILFRPHRIFKFTGTVAVTVTLLTVVFFLAPLWGEHWPQLFSGNTLWLHLVCPLLCLGSFIFCETDEPLRLRDALWGVLPTFVYGNLYLFMVIVLGPERGGWEDFYSFNLGGFWYLSYLGMNVGTYLLSLGILALRGAVIRSKQKT